MRGVSARKVAPAEEVAEGTMGGDLVLPLVRERSMGTLCWASDLGVLGLTAPELDFLLLMFGVLKSKIVDATEAWTVSWLLCLACSVWREVEAIAVIFVVAVMAGEV